MANFSFDASSVAPQVTNGVLPAGTYLAHITESDIRPLASGNGQGLKLTLEIIDGQHKGRRCLSVVIFHFWNVSLKTLSKLGSMCSFTNWSAFTI